MKFLPFFLLFFVVLSCSGIKEQSVDVSELVRTDFKNSCLLSEKRFKPDWWKSFRIKELDNLMRELFENNFDLATAVLKIKEVELVYKRDKTELFPDINLNASYTRTETKNKGFPEIGSDLYKLGISTSYELDIWGKIRSGIKIERLNYLEKILAYDSVAITMSGELAKSYFSLVADYEKKEILEKEMNILQEKLKIVKDRYRRGEVGIDAVFDVMRQIESLKNDMVSVENGIRLFQMQINLLLGKRIDFSFEPEMKKLKVNYDILNVGFPTDLLENRPDIKSAEINLIKAYENVKVARADRFPKLTLTADFSFNDEKIRTIFDNWIFNLAAGLIYPLIDYGKKKRNEEIARIQSQEAFIEYKNAVLKGMKEVESAFSNIKKAKRTIDILKEQITIEKRKAEKVKSDYTNGNGDYTVLLNELFSLYEDEKLLVDAKLAFLLDTIELYKAVGGKYYAGRAKQSEDF